ncbi:MAG: hypothetical protein ACRBK7_27175, partial [Acidimicrobiales bacterium]
GRSDSAITYHVRAGQFSGEGNAILIDGLDRLDAEVADEVTAALCANDRGRSNRSVDDGWLSTNVGDRRGDRALERLCAG